MDYDWKQRKVTMTDEKKPGSEQSSKDLFASKTTISAIGSLIVLVAALFGISPETAEETRVAVEKLWVMGAGIVTLAGTLWGRWKAETRIDSVAKIFKRPPQKEDDA